MRWRNQAKFVCLFELEYKSKCFTKMTAGLYQLLIITVGQKSNTGQKECYFPSLVLSDLSET